ncbi:LysR family transcriptional regulator [Amorphus orientalis]|uniref:LysR family nitrogen assimilation transcriptional regulator n=1 Tax=Amorphus orientalis TaxID=649198 RepID=A0AAE3VLV5_9HYPH|nr:LysR family transcriptional regulator [Amorphus orientalis]MDQ0314328.1 LysR family nitrogen assimilation transcriptional regulator [Amorphus orientalis]
MDNFPQGLTDLHRFLEIAEQGSLTAAAERLGVSQSALSRSVQSLERAYGSRLLDRGKRGVQLTGPGQRLIGRAQEMIRLHDMTVHELSSFDAEPAGRVQIGLPISTSRIFATPLVARVAARYPKVELAITEDISENMEIGLSKGELDLAILVSPKTRRGKLNTAPIAAEQLRVVMAPGHPLATTEALDWHDLARERMVAHPQGNFMRHWLNRMNARYGLNVTVAAEVNSRTLMVELVKAGIGIALLPGSAVAEEVETGAVTARPLEGMRIVWSLAFHNQRPPSGVVARVEAVMLEQAAEVAARGYWTALAGAGLR